MLNSLARITELQSDLLQEVTYLNSIGYCLQGNPASNYDSVYKWSKMLKCCKELGLMQKDKKIVELGGGMSPIQFILANAGCDVTNLDVGEVSWFECVGKYYKGASTSFVEESNKHLNNHRFIFGNAIGSIHALPDNSADAIIDVCSMHIFLGDGTNGLVDEIFRVLKPGGYLISVGDIANPYIGGTDEEFKHPSEIQRILTKNSGLQLLAPFDYATLDLEITKAENVVTRKAFDFNDLSLLNLHYDPKSVNYGNIPILPIHLWVATFIMEKQ